MKKKALKYTYGKHNSSTFKYSSHVYEDILNKIIERTKLQYFTDRTTKKLMRLSIYFKQVYSKKSMKKKLYIGIFRDY